MERMACWTRRGHGGRQFVHGNGFLTAAYVHRSSRAGDPQLHTHVLVANATRGPDGRWTRLYHPAIYDHAKTAGYLYEANLRHELTRRLGVRWREVENGIAEIEGFDPDHLRAFSTRRAEILAASAPDASARARQIATLETRKAKDRDLTEESLRERWRATAEEIGLDRAAIRRTFGREAERAARVAPEALAGELTSRASHFDRRDVIQTVANWLPGGDPAAEIEELADAFLALDQVVAVGATAKGPRYTTARIWEIEREALAAARAMGEAGGFGVVQEIAVARVLASRSTIKSDQQAMVGRLTRGGEQLVVVVGEAGTGKTFATVTPAKAWASAGVGLRVAAPTWRAASVLRSEGLDAISVARLLGELDRAAAADRRELRPGSVLMVDEAGMVDSAALARLIDHARAAEAKLVLVGDPAQLGEIEAGGLFAAIVARTDPVVLDQVIRHEHELDREGARRIREGKGAEAVEVYRSAERVTVCEDPEARREEMVADWWRSYREGEDALMVAKRNAEVARLNALAREVMRAEGRLGDREFEVGDARFAVGDRVITRVNDHRAEIYNRERWRIEAIDAGGRGVELVGIDASKRVGVDADYLGRVNPSDSSPALQHAYAATTYQAQGSTVDRAYVMADPSMDRQEFYVAASRSRGETFFYATPEIDLEREEYAPRSSGREGLAHIAAAAERDGAQVSAHDQALRSKLDGLSSPELARLRDEFASEAGAEARTERARQALDKRITETEGLLDRGEAERGGLGRRPRRGKAKNEYDAALFLIGARERMSLEALGRHEAERSELPPRRPRGPRRGGGDRRDPRPAPWSGARRGAGVAARPHRRRAGGEAGRGTGAGRLGGGGAGGRGLSPTDGASGQRHGARAAAEGLSGADGARARAAVDQAGTAGAGDRAGAEDRAGAGDGDRALRARRSALAPRVDRAGAETGVEHDVPVGRSRDPDEREARRVSGGGGFAETEVPGLHHFCRRESDHDERDGAHRSGVVHRGGPGHESGTIRWHKPNIDHGSDDAQGRGR
jgi:ATP-dependent exoDNAse (exonuclease V) alpha subunit